MHRGGFTLLELSVVLAIISVIVVAGLSMGNSLLTGTTQMAARNRLAVVKAALDEYARENGHLPCPAFLNKTPSDAGYAVEARDKSNPPGPPYVNCDSGLAHPTGVYIGGLPSRNLGLPDQYAADPWNNKLTYAVSDNMVGDRSNYARNDGHITVQSGVPGGATYTISTKYNSVSGEYNTVDPGATYVVISHGPNGMGATPVATGLADSCGGGVDHANCDNNSIFYDMNYVDSGTTSGTRGFDDIVVWGSNILAREPKSDAAGLGCTGSCEAWCAKCTVLPQTGFSGDTPAIVCSRTLVSSTPNCRALCVYSYPNANMGCP